MKSEVIFVLNEVMLLYFERILEEQDVNANLEFPTESTKRISERNRRIMIQGAKEPNTIKWKSKS